VVIANDNDISDMGAILSVDLQAQELTKIKNTAQKMFARSPCQKKMPMKTVHFLTPPFMPMPVVTIIPYVVQILGPSGPQHGSLGYI
jgi:hypothetical protein